MVTLQFHLDVGEIAVVYWWVDSPDAPYMYVTAATLRQCRALALGVLHGEGIDTNDIRDVLIDARSEASLW
jgi:hypothetical protein